MVTKVWLGKDGKLYQDEELQKIEAGHMLGTGIRCITIYTKATNAKEAKPVASPKVPPKVPPMAPPVVPIMTVPSKPQKKDSETEFFRF